MREPFETPEDIILDPVSGYAVNIAVSRQGWPFWWEDEPETFARIKSIRETLDLEIDDFPDGIPVRHEDRVVTMEEVLEHYKAEAAQEEQ